MTIPKAVRLNYEALHRIRLAAGMFPADMNINELGRQLSKAIYDYRCWASLRDIKPQKKRLKKIQKTARDLASLLKEDEEDGVLAWCQQWPKDRSPPSEVVEEIQRMANESVILKILPQEIIRDIKDENAVSGSANEWLITRLQDVFKQFFYSDLLPKRKQRFLDFAEAVYMEFGIEQPSRATIVRDRSRKGRSRRGGQK